jgi:hypothetical protein
MSTMALAKPENSDVDLLFKIAADVRPFRSSASEDEYRAFQQRKQYSGADATRGRWPARRICSIEAARFCNWLDALEWGLFV